MSLVKLCLPEEKLKICTEWAERNGLKISSASHKGLRFLNKDVPFNGYDCRFPGYDHVTYWNKDGKPYCIVSQPYHFDSNEAASAAVICEKYNFYYIITTYPSWHNIGSVLFMEWRRKK